jgi:hypothetical protein
LPDGHKLWPAWLRKIDTLLEDEAVIEVVAQALEIATSRSLATPRLSPPRTAALPPPRMKRRRSRAGSGA